MIRTADVSECGAYRYTLDRDWRADRGLFAGDVSQAPRRVVWIMANPSTADGQADDPTVRRIVKFSQAWGFDSLRVVNLSPVIDPNPKRALLVHRALPEAVRSRNLNRLQAFGAELVVAAWGAVGAPFLEGDPELRAELERLRPRLHVLATTKHGFPTHPLARGKHRIPDHARPIRWTS